jgi:hypothetical protein
VRVHVHSVSLLLDYPCSSNVRQWSHIDGEQNYFQGSVLCGNDISVTMEFPILSPHIQETKDLELLWSFFPKDTCVFSEIGKSEYCTELLKKYGCLFNHDAEHPNNPVSLQKKEAKTLVTTKKDTTMKNKNSIYPAGTILRMPGNTIHAGPPSDKNNCRALFFYAASHQSCLNQYDPETQWNQVTLCCAILIDIWTKIKPLERALFLEYIRRVQSNPKVAPSDTCMFVNNYTLRLFIRICLFLQSPRSSHSSFKVKYIHFLYELCHNEDISVARQLISRQMIVNLDITLLERIFICDEKNSAKEYFQFYN